MKITVFYNRKSFLGNHTLFTEESETVHNLDELKRFLKVCFSSMKKEWSSVSFRIESASGYYLVVDKYDAQANSFKVIFHERWNSEDSPTFWSQKNISSWAADVLKADSEDAA